MIQPERTPFQDVFLVAGIFLLVFVGLIVYVAANQTPEPVTPAPTPAPTLTETPAPTPTPAPEPTESLNDLMLRTNGYHMRDWLHWYRQDVQGINGQGTKDLSAWITVYDYLFTPNYHYHSVSWGTDAFFRESPAPGMKYLFVFINYYTDGYDVRPYVFDSSRFNVHANGVAYYPEDIYNPSYQIKELDHHWNYAHTEDPNVPYGYKVVQDAGTGIIRAEKQEVIYGGRSNAIDGYIVFQVPTYESAHNLSVHGAFSNLGGQAWWQLEDIAPVGL